MESVLKICKGYYDKDKFDSVLSALEEYWHKNCSCEETLTKDKANEIFLQPLVLSLIKEEHSLAQYLVEPCTAKETEMKYSFSELMYCRFIHLIRMADDKICDKVK